MERRKAIGVASAVSMAAAGAMLAVGANFGLIGTSTVAAAPPLPVSTSAGVPATTTTVTVPAEPQVIEEVQVIEVPGAAPGVSPSAAPEAPSLYDDHDEADDGGEEGGEDGGDDHSDSPQPGATTVSAPGSTGSPSTTEGPAPTFAHESGEDEDGPEQEPCEVHDDGQVECHEHDD